MTWRGIERAKTYRTANPEVIIKLTSKDVTIETPSSPTKTLLSTVQTKYGYTIIRETPQKLLAKWHNLELTISVGEDAVLTYKDNSKTSYTIPRTGKNPLEGKYIDCEIFGAVTHQIKIDKVNGDIIFHLYPISEVSGLAYGDSKTIPPITK